MFDEMAEGESAEILGGVVKAAKGGDVRAAEIVLPGMRQTCAKGWPAWSAAIEHLGKLTAERKVVCENATSVNQRHSAGRTEWI
jgi:hypothetical protein